VSAASPTTPSNLDAVIVGAGFAGLSAAEHLRAMGRRTVVLEASARVGGRARSGTEVGNGWPNELGALMVHGRHAPAHGWARHYGLKVRPLPVLQSSRIARGGKVGRYPWFALPLHPVVGSRATVAGIRTIPRALLQYAGPDLPLSTLEDEWGVDGPARLLVELLHAHVHSADPDSVGVRGPAEEGRAASEEFGFYNFQIAEGYSALAQRSAASLGEIFRFGRVVTEVVTEEEGVLVRAQSNGQDEEYRARSAVITVPLGVLKAGTIAFDPPLSEVRRRAIERVAVGEGYAVSLRLRGGTMRERLGDFALLWGGTASTFYRPHVGLRAPTEVVTAFTVGREAQRRSRLGREEVVRATLEEWTGVVPAGVTLGAVEAADVHFWALDPWARGTYSFLPPGATLNDRRELARPLGDRVFFAGEATSLTGDAATVSGAIATGRRAADEALAALGQPVRPLLSP